jgi:D-arabinose 1-dehydrogenase-like Zn-dependent alcohol dehydrogenase
MNATHTATMLGGTSAVAMLTVLLTGFHGLDDTHATAAAWLISTGVGSIGMLVAWWIKWRYPAAPPLPHA